MRRQEKEMTADEAPLSRVRESIVGEGVVGEGVGDMQDSGKSTDASELISCFAYVVAEWEAPHIVQRAFIVNMARF